MQLYQASHQWASRPADERFLSVTALHEATLKMRKQSRGAVVSSRSIEIQPTENDAKGLQVVGPVGNGFFPTHHAFGQLARLVNAPAGYLRGLPAPIAADALNFGLRYDRDIQDVGLLLRQNGSPVLAAATGPNYGRIWNSDVAKAILEHYGDGITGDFTVPGEFGKKVPITEQNTTLYAGDRDMFIFLADEENRIEIPNRRDGQSGALARGFFVWNSEVGDRTLGMASFLFDYACMNRIVWGACNFEQITVRHTVSAPDKWIEEVTPAIQAYANSSSAGVVKAVTDARAKRVDNIDEFLAKRFTKREAQNIVSAFQTDEGRPLGTKDGVSNLWDIATGITAFARGIQFQDKRVELERKAGKILDMAS